MINKLIRLFSKAEYLDIFVKVKENASAFIDSLQIGDNIWKYTLSQRTSNYYNSSFGILFNKLAGLQNGGKKLIFIQEQSGLFIDKTLLNEKYIEGDDWGARHLTILVLASLYFSKNKPKLKIACIREYFQKLTITEWLEKLDWEDDIAYTSNHVMNIGALLQYSRDYENWGKSKQLIKELQIELLNRVNPKTGMWGNVPRNKTELSNQVQAAYHFWMILWYDNIVTSHRIEALSYIKKLQNFSGGFSVRRYSSACEDIDAIIPLINLNIQEYGNIVNIRKILFRSLKWLISNQNKDGGFVFRRSEGFEYGHPTMFSSKDESSIFATWFRMLTVAYIIRSLYPNQKLFNIQRFPGYWPN